MIGRVEKWAWRAPLVAVVGLLGVWTADRTPPVKQIVNQSEGLAIAGDHVTIISLVERDRLCETRLGRVFYDSRGERTVLPSLEFTPAGPVGSDHYRQRIPVPAYASPGPGKIAFSLSWVCNASHLIWPITDSLTVRVVVERP